LFYFLYDNQLKKNYFDFENKCLSLLLAQIAKKHTTLQIPNINDLKLFSSLANTNIPAQLDAEEKRKTEISDVLDPIVTAVNGSGIEDEYSILLCNFVQFINLTKGEQVKELLSDSGIGLLVFSSCYNQFDKFFPIYDLEFDCRGDVDCFYSEGGVMTYAITAGEIKSSAEGIHVAKEQLGKRLAVMEEALRIMPHYKASVKKAASSASACASASGSTPVKNTTSDAPVVLRGIVFLPAVESKHYGKSQSLPSSTDFQLKCQFY